MPRRAVLVLSFALLAPARAGAAPICVYVAAEGVLPLGTVAAPCAPYDGDVVCRYWTGGPPEARETVTVVSCLPPG